MIVINKDTGKIENRPVKIKEVKKPSDLAIELYQDFCEGGLSIPHPVQDAWNKCEEQFGPIEISGPTACIDELFLQTIQYTLDSLGIEK